MDDSLDPRLIAVLQAIRGPGYTWPTKDSKSLAQCIAGFKDIQSMPSSAAGFAVAAFLALAAPGILLAIGLFDPFSPKIILKPQKSSSSPKNHPQAPKIILKLILAGPAVGFFVRGIFSFLPFWRWITPEQLFAQLDRRYYGPLCLCLSLMLIGIVTQV